MNDKIRIAKERREDAALREAVDRAVERSTAKVERRKRIALRKESDLDKLERGLCVLITAIAWPFFFLSFVW